MAEFAPVHLIATPDGKRDEAKFLADSIKPQGVPESIVDVGTLSPQLSCGDIDHTTVTSASLTQTCCSAETIGERP